MRESVSWQFLTGILFFLWVFLNSIYINWKRILHNKAVKLNYRQLFPIMQLEFCVDWYSSSPHILMLPWRPFFFVMHKGESHVSLFPVKSAVTVMVPTICVSPPPLHHLYPLMPP